MKGEKTVFCHFELSPRNSAYNFIGLFCTFFIGATCPQNRVEQTLVSHESSIFVPCSPLSQMPPHLPPVDFIELDWAMVFRSYHQTSNSCLLSLHQHFSPDCLDSSSQLSRRELTIFQLFPAFSISNPKKPDKLYLRC
jgi:hypothetical protein